MTTITLNEWRLSPQIMIGEKERQRVEIAAMTDTDHSADHVDFLLYELDRAKVVPDAMLPGDVVRIGSLVRYRPLMEDERTVKLVMPEGSVGRGAYRLSVVSEHGAVLLGTRPGDIMTWTDPSGAQQRLRVISVYNPPADGNNYPPPAA